MPFPKNKKFTWHDTPLISFPSITFLIVVVGEVKKEEEDNFYLNIQKQIPWVPWMFEIESCKCNHNCQLDVIDFRLKPTCILSYLTNYFFLGLITQEETFTILPNSPPTSDVVSDFIIKCFLSPTNQTGFGIPLSSHWVLFLWCNYVKWLCIRPNPLLWAVSSSRDMKRNAITLISHAQAPNKHFYFTVAI